MWWQSNQFDICNVWGTIKLHKQPVKQAGSNWNYLYIFPSFQKVTLYWKSCYTGTHFRLSFLILYTDRFEGSSCLYVFPLAPVTFKQLTDYSQKLMWTLRPLLPTINTNMIARWIKNRSYHQKVRKVKYLHLWWLYHYACLKIYIHTDICTNTHVPYNNVLIWRAIVKYD
jgi:hypothetical protein